MNKFGSDYIPKFKALCYLALDKKIFKFSFRDSQGGAVLATGPYFEHTW